MRCTVPIQYLLIMGTWSASQNHPENVSNKTSILWDLNDEYALFCLIISSAKCKIESVTLNRRPERPGRGVRGNSLVALGGYSWRQRSNNYPMSAHPLQLDTSLGPHTVCQICTQFDTFVVAVSTFLCTMGRVEWSLYIHLDRILYLPLVETVLKNEIRNLWK